MPSKVLLISVNRCTHPDPVFPLGLACLTTALRKAGHDCRWLDLLIDDSIAAAQLDGWRPDYTCISLRNIDDVLIRTRETYYQHVGTFGEAARREFNCPVIVGGSGFSVFPREVFEMSGADFGITGEGETSLVALIQALESDGNWRAVPGLVYRDGDKVRQNLAAPAPFDQVVAAEDRLARVTNYYLSQCGTLNVQTQRGCAWRCCYCTYPLIEGRAHRRRPAELVADEFAQLERAGARFVFIVDSIFNSSPRHVTEVCEALIRRNNKLPWGCFLRPHGLTPELMRLMARAGLSHAEFGSDSFCDEVLAAYHKGFRFEDVLRASEAATQAKVDYCHFLIAGGPGETEETLERGFENSKRLNNPVIMAVVGMRIYPDTELFDRAVAEGVVQRGASLLQPAYYIAPGLTQEGIFTKLKSFSQRSPNWITGDPDPAYNKLVTRLRQRGVVGPLWGYAAMIQRLWPHGPRAGAEAREMG